MASTSGTGVNPQYIALNENLTSLTALFEGHSAYPSARPRNKVQFMHEFLTITQRQLAQVDPSTPKSQKNEWSECLQRSVFAQMLIEDGSGQLSAMTNEKPGQELDLGEDIRRAAKNLVPDDNGKPTAT